MSWWLCGSGVDPGFSKGGLTVMRGRMAMARGRVQERAQKLLPCVLNICIFCGILHLFIAARFLLACVFGELASYLILMHYK